MRNLLAGAGLIFLGLLAASALHDLNPAARAWTSFAASQDD